MQNSSAWPLKQHTGTLILCQLNLRGAGRSLLSKIFSAPRGEADFMSINQQEPIHSSDRLDRSALPKRPKKGQTPE